MSEERRLVSAHVASGAYPKGFKWDTARTLTHAVYLNVNGEPVAVLCGKVKPESILPDRSTYDTHPVTCPACQRKVYRKTGAGVSVSRAQRRVLLNAMKHESGLVVVPQRGGAILLRGLRAAGYINERGCITDAGRQAVRSPAKES